MAKCPICLVNIVSGTQSGNLYSLNCVRCGRYKITASVRPLLEEGKFTERQRANLSGWLFENPEFSISRANVDPLLKITTPSFHSRADKLLLKLENETEFAGDYLQEKPLWLGVTSSINREELIEILEFLVSSNRIFKNPARRQHYKIAPDGWAYLQKLKETNPQSMQCFVAMWFDDQMKQIYDEAFAKAILEAGYKPHRVDQREYNDKIDDEIIVQIRRSRFIVADFTGQRGGVYYEAGFAKGLGLEVIWTCRKDEIEKLHFDIRQYNCIDWEKEHLTQFTQRLTKRIESVFGHGNYKI